ncbi:Metal-dependent hydrolase involved in phosphonate metabolism (plasmid) [Sinorhizobium sojae CCBAU 05684]|uniref:Metal-dependent hydrolase involved in phosphonate metabolism n=1 Tax=Sinorhizobium sojae CCBAU 05684 TaxID=716928 RepID=A0A249PLX7_9HYPH|nr:alpha-D-ribose 1-methylphosphonate 5-triphosphate diphosphatase [Sinorhizobium sojae]ASY66911.1 Metal-dependent hydrolase involved in phosphonate metabolism [Sinorhizobium sojae CCBAU 05684]
MNVLIKSGIVLRPEGAAKADLAIEDGRFAAVVSRAATTIDAEGLVVLPGIVDIHGDGFERHLMPRPGVRFDVAIALRDTDRQLVANGITTAFHGVTVSWEPGLRSVEAAAEVIRAIQSLRDSLSCDTRLHIRWETFALEQLPRVLEWLGMVPRPIIALNDHTTGSVLKGTIARKLPQMAERSGLSQEAYKALLDSVWARRAAVPASIETVAKAAKANGNVLLAHDEATPEERRRFRALGAHSSEFPLTLETAAEACRHDEHVILGAPNVVRGGSHNGALNAADAIRAGLCTCLASDYHYPSPLHAAFKLAGSDLAGLGKAWKLISSNPAAAAGLNDRGTIDPGKRADLLLVDASRANHPEIVASFCGGRLVYATRALHVGPAPVAVA